MFALAAGQRRRRTRRSPCRRRRAGSCSCPAVIALFFASSREPVARRARDARRAPALGSRSSTRPTRSSSPSRSPASSSRARCSRGARSLEGLAGLAAVVVPAGAGRALAAADRARDRVASTRRRTRCSARSQHYKGQLDVFSDGSYRLAPGGLRPQRRGRGRGARSPFRSPCSPPGAAGRRSCSAGSRRARADARARALHPLRRRRLDLAGPARRRLRPVRLRARRRRGRARAAASIWSRCRSALGAGIAFQLAYPGRLRLRRSTRAGPAIATWIALVGGAAALVAGDLPPAAPRNARPHGPAAAATALCVVLPVALHGFTPLGRAPEAWKRLTPGLVQRAADEGARAGGRLLRRRHELPDRRVRPRLRRERAARPRRRHEGEPARTSGATTRSSFFRTGDLAIPRRYGATGSWSTAR